MYALVALKYRIKIADEGQARLTAAAAALHSGVLWHVAARR
jgi:hypothetical protein